MTKRVPASFRDPSAFIFIENGLFLRHIGPEYKQHYDHLLSSGLYLALTQKKWLIEHEEIADINEGAYKTIKPRQIKFFNYPHEWSFKQLKDAALLTLNILKESLQYGMILKDATGFNIVFEENRPVFIDTTSFELYDDTKPWVAYRQFCEQFLAPLLLAKYRGSSMLGLQLQYPDGVPISVAANLLPARSRFSMLCLLHIYLQNAVSGSPQKSSKNFSKEKLGRIISHLENGISNLAIKNDTITWSKYYVDDILSKQYLEDKRRKVSDLTKDLNLRQIVDLGANTGEFAALFKGPDKLVIAADFDPLCVDEIYSTQNGITPVVLNLMYPTPSMGWMNKERSSFFERVNADLVLSLALIHHLCISKNLSLDLLAQGLSKLGEYLLIEFVPIDDPKVVILLKNRDNIFHYYNETNFRMEFSCYFEILKEASIDGSMRKLFLMKRKIIH